MPESTNPVRIPDVHEVLALTLTIIRTPFGRMMQARPGLAEETRPDTA
ncbi:MAG TPA: hypothetical protein VHZ28_06375 [Terracidiphilus sp.]|nr:hypothetical protein [Terracidiphilus sp.]